MTWNSNCPFLQFSPDLTRFVRRARLRRQCCIRKIRSYTISVVFPRHGVTGEECDELCFRENRGREPSPRSSSAGFGFFPSRRNYHSSNREPPGFELKGESRAGRREAKSHSLQRSAFARAFGAVINRYPLSRIKGLDFESSKSKSVTDLSFITGFK